MWFQQSLVTLAWAAPAGLLPKMPKLRWAQALTAGVEGWLALSDLPPDLTLTCARGTHRESMPENILGALFYLTKPYAACVEDQKHSKWTRRTAIPLTAGRSRVHTRLSTRDTASRRSGGASTEVTTATRTMTVYPAVLSTPPHELTEPVCGSDQTALPVVMSIARSSRCAGSGAGANDPPMKPLPASQSAGTFVKTPHLSFVCT